MDKGKENYSRFLDGDDSGFVEIIKEYKDGLILYLSSFTSDLLLAEELTEETFVKIVTKKPSFSGNSSFKTWLFTIAKNATLDHLRKNRRHPTVSVELYPALSDEETDLEKNYLKEEQKILLHRTLRKLRPEHRMALILTYFEGFSNKETAKILGKNLHSTEMLISRARQSLREELEKEGFQYEKL